MHSIIKTRKTVSYFVIYNVVSTALYYRWCILIYISLLKKMNYTLYLLKITMPTKESQLKPLLQYFL